jgi:vacuolar-type H+-ATPase subunit F/Vma7
MTSLKYLDIAIIGDEDLVNGLRLSGVSRYYVVKGDPDAQEDVRRILAELMTDPKVGIVMILEDYAEYVQDLLVEAREEKNLTPVIIEVPSKYGTKYQDIRAFYKAYTRKFIGFEVEI